MSELKLSGESLDWALLHLEKHGDTDIFPVPFEYAAIKQAWTDTGDDPAKPRPSLRSILADQDMHLWKTRPYRRCLSPKHRYGFRVSTQLDPLDTLILTAIIYEIGHELESSRVEPAKQVVHSYRFKGSADGDMYNPEWGYDTFRKRALERAESSRWVVLADIADFFPSIYSHPLENALRTAAPRTGLVSVLVKMLASWNLGISYGIPVGPSAPRLLAEIAIADIDSALLAEGYELVRFVDDYRIFCDTRREAYEALAFLANALFENHGLSLQQHKTEILDAEAFISRFSRSAPEATQDALSEKFREVLEEIDIPDGYDPIDFDDLDPEVQRELNAMNMKGILEAQVAADNPDMGLVRFILRRLGQLGDESAQDLVFDHIDELYPVFRHCMQYLSATIPEDAAEASKLGDRAMALVTDDVVGHLEYHRAWIYSLFAGNHIEGKPAQLLEHFANFSDQFSRRELISALGRSGHDTWFKSRKRNYQELGPWVKRAFIAAASCLPGDEGKFWYRAIGSHLDLLETAVVRWARQNPRSE